MARMGGWAWSGGETTKKVSNKQASKAKPKETTAAIPKGNQSGAASLAAKQKKSGAPQVTKAELILKKLRTAKGASVETLMADTGWQAHSVRGFLSATVKKKMALALMSEVGKDGVRRYRIDNGAKA